MLYYTMDKKSYAFAIIMVIIITVTNFAFAFYINDYIPPEPPPPLPVPTTPLKFQKLSAVNVYDNEDTSEFIIYFGFYFTDDIVFTSQSQIRDYFISNYSISGRTININQYCYYDSEIRIAGFGTQYTNDFSVFFTGSSSWHITYRNASSLIPYHSTISLTSVLIGDIIIL